MIAVIGFFIVLTGGLVAFAWAMGPIADGWGQRAIAARTEAEAIRRRIYAARKGVPIDSVDWGAVHRGESPPPEKISYGKGTNRHGMRDHVGDQR